MLLKTIILAKGANCSVKDSFLNTPLHIFVALKAKLYDKDATDVDKEENDLRMTVDDYKYCIDLLIKHGAKIEDRNHEGESVFLDSYFQYPF